MKGYSSLLVLIATAGLCYASADDFVANLTATGVEVVFPSNAAYAGDSSAYNERFTVDPAVVTYPTSSNQVAQVVQVGAAFGYNVIARSGGHSYIANGLGGKSGSVVVDLSKLTQMTVASSGLATVQTGNRLGDIATTLYNAGRALPHGTCPYVGIGGHSSFGGWGFTSRMWGLNLDPIQSLEVVLANGTITTVSGNDDLFWAMRGAGPSFGITTAITYQTFPAPASATVFEYGWNLSPAEAANAVSAFQIFATTNLPSQFGAEFVIGRGNAAGELNFGLTGGWYGPEQNLSSVIAPFLAQVGEPDSTTLVPGTYINSVSYLGGGSLSTSSPDTRDTFYAKSLMTPAASPISDAALLAFMNYMANEGSQADVSWFVEMDFYGGTNSAVNAVGATATAFGHRNSLWTLQLYASSGSPPFPSDGFTFLDNMVASLTDNSPADWDIGAYPNYADDQLANWQTLYFGSNYQRLVSIKQEYDPNNVFTFPQSIGSQ